MPGIAGIETIMTFHNAKMIGDIRSTWGNMTDNPVQDMTREINAMCKPDFMLNVTLNKEKKLPQSLLENYMKHTIKDAPMLRLMPCLNVIIVLT